MGKQAKELYDDARRLLDTIVEKKKLTARAVYGFYPANRVGDDILLYDDEARTHVHHTVHQLRQQQAKPAGQFNTSLADFIAPRDVGREDYLGAFAVTTGHGTDEMVKQFESEHDDYNKIMTQALSDRLAEAFAEFLHLRARQDWGYGQEETSLSKEDLIREKYRGIRPAPGYPACPDHTEKPGLFRLLGVEKSVGITLTESCAMYPASSVSGWYFGHPDSKYFAVGKLERDQGRETTPHVRTRPCTSWNAGWLPI